MTQQMQATREGDWKWRIELWEHMFARIPAEVVMDLSTGYFNVRDGAGNYLYADDLDAETFDEIVAEWAELLSPQDEAAFFDAFCLKQVERCQKRGKRKIKMLACYAPSGEPAQPMEVRLKFRKTDDDPEMEFRFTPVGGADGHQLPVGRADGHQLPRWGDGLLSP